MMSARTIAAPLLCLLACVAGVHAQPRIDMNDDPETERRLLVVPEGFEVQLVAAEPDVVNPVQINFDPEGRLWVLCIPRYPQLLPGQDPRDYVLVLEDFDAKGKARKSRVFADRLTVPTGIAPGDRGVYVGQADKLLHLKDSNGTGKATERRILLAGFGTQDTHHTLNSFRWGPDGNLYFNQGIYIKSTVETPYGPRTLWGGCIWQLRPDRLRLEVHDRSILGTNTWGHIFDAWGQSFCTTAWPDGIHLVLPDSPLTASSDKGVVPPLPLTRVADGRHCGATFISGRHFPDDWQGNLISGSFAQQLLYRYQISDSGSKFTGKQLAPLLISKHRKFRPVDVQMGPDGALYVADWYDEVIQHNQIDFRDPRRDHSRGRIWRIVHTDLPLVTPPKLTGVSVDDVLEQLKAPEQWTRQQAKRALAERNAKEVAARLDAWVRRLDAKDADLPRHLLEALWVCQTIDHIDIDLLTRVLSSADPRARAAATRVLGAWHERVPGALRLLAAQAADPQPRVRLEAVLAACRVPSPNALESALCALAQPSEPLVDFALRKTALVLKPYWYPEFQKGRLTFGADTKRLTFALQAIQAADAVPALVQLLQANQVDPANRAAVLALIALLGNSDQQALAWKQAARLKAAELQHLLTAFAEAMRQRKVQPALTKDDVALLGGLFIHADPALAEAAVHLAGSWKQEALRKDLESQTVGEDPRRRRAAVAALVDLGGPASVQYLETQASNKSYALRLEALIGLATLDAKRAAAPAARLLQQPTTALDDPGSLFITFLQRSGGAQALAEALHTVHPSSDAAKIGLRTLNTLGTPAPALLKVLQEAAGVGGPARAVTPAELQRLLALVQSQGDASRGEAVFRRPALGCLQCHAIGGAGSRVGPDLGGIGSSAQVDYLLESILLPAKVIREGYNTAHVVTHDGKAYSGVIVRETPQELVLRNPTSDELIIPKRDIDERNSAGSLMPDGLAQNLTDAELADLVRFLSELGRPGPFAVSHVRVARRWQYLAAIPESLVVLSPSALGQALRDDARLVWTTAYSMVSGDLALADVRPDGEANLAIVRCEIEATTSGPVVLHLNNTRGLRLWVDGAPAEVSERTRLTFERGIHRLDFAIEQPSSGRRLRCELAEGEGRFAGGK
jgi:putative heme-binding domain-containing protein